METDNFTCKLKHEYHKKLNLNPREFGEVLDRISREVFPMKQPDQDVEEFISYRLSRWLCAGIQIKLSQHRPPQIPHRVNITYQSENRFMNENYPENVKSALFSMSDFRFVEDLYNSFDDLKYVIYRATEIAKFICAYDINLNIKNMIEYYENIQEEHDIYRDIETYQYDIPGLQIFKDSLLSKSTFLKRPLVNFPDVVSELDRPLNVWANAYNNTIETRKKNIEDLLKIETFKQYSVFIKNQIHDNLKKNVDECVRVYGSVDNALNTMGEQMNRFINNFYIPQTRDEPEFKQIEEVYDLCEMKLGPEIVYNSIPFLVLKSNLLLKTQKNQKIALRNYRTSIDAKRISNKDITRIIITKDNVNNSDFKILAPNDKSVSFRDSSGKTFESVSDYAHFNVIREFFNISDDNTDFDTILNNILCTKTVEVVNRFVDGNPNVLNSLPANTHLILPDFIGEVVGNYLTNLKNQQRIVVKNKKIIKWCETRADDMYNTLSLFEHTLNPLNILNTIYCYSTLNIPIIIESDYRTNPKYEDIFPYISGFIASIIASEYSEDDILQMIGDGSKHLSSTLISNIQILELIGFMIWIIRSRITNEDQDIEMAHSRPHTDQEKHRVICILLNQKLNKMENLSDEKILSLFRNSLGDDKKLNTSVLSRLNFFKDTMATLSDDNFFDRIEMPTIIPGSSIPGSPSGSPGPYYNPLSPPYIHEKEELPESETPDYLSNIQQLNAPSGPETPDYRVNFKFKDTRFVF